MTGRFTVQMIAGAIMLSGCATHIAGKPILTAGVFQRVAAACGASDAKFHRQRKALPFVNFVVHDDEKNPDAPNPTVTCVDTGLKPYRYDFMGFKGDHPVAE